MKLVTRMNGNTIHTLHLKEGGQYTIGRQLGSDVLLQSLQGISRQHFILKFDHKVLSVQVVSSKGTLLHHGEETSAFDVLVRESFELPPYHFELQESSTHELTSTSQSEEDYSEVTVAGATPLQPYLQMHVEGEDPQLIQLSGQSWVAGRDALSDIVLNDIKASRKHFEIFQEESQYFVRDLKSSNGTLINGTALSTEEPHVLESGDVLQVGQLVVSFQLRRTDTIESSDTHDVYHSTDFSANEPQLSSAPQGGATLLGVEHSKKRYDRKTIVRAAIALAALVVIGYSSLPEKEKQNREPSSPAQNHSELDKLSADQKLMIENSYNLAKNHFLNQKYELALSQLSKIHKIVNSYKDSRHYEELCIEARDLKIQREEIERQKEDERVLRERVDQIIAHCKKKNLNVVKPEEIKACLAPALDLDPNHPDALQMVSYVEKQEEARQIQQSQKLAYLGQVGASESLYFKAQKLERQKKIKEAIAAYSAHLRSSLPDPKNLKSASQKAKARLENQLSVLKLNLYKQAQDAYSSGNLAQTIVLCRQSLDIETSNNPSLALLNKARNELNNKLKNLYLDSVLQEKFGNVDAAKDLWKQILDTDVKDGEFYLKAKSKLIQYGANQ